jgi:hypothetical protein
MPSGAEVKQWTGVQLARRGDPSPHQAAGGQALFPVYGDGSRLVVALELRLEVGLEVGSKLIVPGGTCLLCKEAGRRGGFHRRGRRW